MIQKILSFFTSIFLILITNTKNISPVALTSPSPTPPIVEANHDSPSQPPSIVQITLIPIPTVVGANHDSPISPLPEYPTGATDDDKPWGIAEQIGEHTWTMKIESDPSMAKPQEILQALNAYRRRYGSSDLNWNQKLADYAQGRAKFFTTNKGLDSHQGFNDFLENDHGFEELGFTSLGENASFGYRLNGVHLIEWIYAGDEPHDKNQKNSRWAYVGVGVDGTSTCLIFATGKI